MIPKFQKAIVAAEVGKPLVLTTTRVVPQPSPKQVLIRVKVAGPNPHDQKARDVGLFIKDNLPAVLTNDVAGEVVAIGSEALRYTIGDQVVGQATFDKNYFKNGFQEYAVLDEDYTFKIPEGFTLDDGATLPTNIIAPLVAFFDKDSLGFPAPWTPEATTFDFKGTTLLVIGGGSNCGRLGTQLAVLAGIGTVIVVGGDEAELKTYGATHIIDRHLPEDEINTQIRAIVGDDLVYAYDAVNNPDGQHIAVNALSSSKRGKLVRLVRGDLDQSKIHPKQQGYETLNTFGLSSAKPDLCMPFWELLPQYLVEGKIKPTQYEVVEGLDVDRVNEVLDRYRDGKKVIKTHFHVSA